jgi:hypothetical protein
MWGCQVAIDIVDDTDNVQLRSNGSSVSFPGYLAVLKVALDIFSVSNIFSLFILFAACFFFFVLVLPFPNGYK